MNKAIVTVRKVGNETIRRESALKASHINRALVIKKSTPANMRVSISARLAGIPISVNALSQGKPFYKANRTKRGLTAKVSKGRPKVIKGGFAHDRFAGGRAFKRRGRPRLPIQQLYGPSIYSQFKKDHVQLAMDRTWVKRLRIEIQRAEDFILRTTGII